MGIEVRLLGGFSLRIRGATIKGLSARHQSLITYLALRSETPVYRSEIAYNLWRDSKESQALTNLRKVLHKLKNIVPDLIGSDSRILYLNLSQDDHVDVRDFTSRLEAAKRARLSNDTDQEQNEFEAATVIYGGELLPNCYEEWILPERERLHNLYIHGTDRLIALLEARQYYRDAIKHAQRLLQADNLREETYRTLIRLHALNNDRAAALNVYHSCVRILSEELDVDPDTSTRELYENLLKSDTQLLRTPKYAVPVSHPLIAREQDWKLLTAKWKHASKGKLGMVVLSGEAGIGKTRLAEDFLRWATRQGIRTSFAACYSAQGNLSYTPLITWLRSMPLAQLEQPWQEELSRILPELRMENFVSRPITEGWQKQIFFEALARALLAQNEALLLLLDDMQWCDNDTLEWLRYFMRFDKKARILILATLRAEDLHTRSSLQSLFIDLRATTQLSEIELTRFNREQTISLGENMLEKELSESEGERLFGASEGVPLFAVELARKGLGGGSANRLELDSVENETLPPRLQAVLDSRLARLSSPARALIEVASIIGREFTFALLRKTSELDEGATIQALDELWQRRMVRERGGGTYDFSHEKLREATLAGISPVRRQWLHQRTAESLETENSNENLVHIADHFEQAGIASKSADYYARAADYEQSIYAFQDALVHLTHAIQLETNQTVLANLHEERGDVLSLLGHRNESFQAFANAAALTTEHLQKARLARKQVTLISRHDIVIAHQKYMHALDELKFSRSDKDYWSEWIETLFAWIEACYWQQDSKNMDVLLKKINNPVELHGTLDQKIEYRRRILSSALVRDRLLLKENYVEIAQENVELAIKAESPYQISSTKRQLGLVALCANQLVISELAFLEAIDLSKKNGDYTTLVIAQAYISIVHRRMQRIQDVRTDLKALTATLMQTSQNPEYQAVREANIAWLSYTEGRKKKARQLAQRALKDWKLLSSPYPFRWLAIFVLLALSIEEQKMEEAFDYARALLVAPQQRLIPEVEAAIRSALEPDSERKKFDVDHFENMLSRARNSGYL